MADETKAERQEQSKPLSTRKLNEALKRVNTELALAEATYMSGLFKSLSEAGNPNLVMGDPDESNWIQVSQGNTLATTNKLLAEALRDPEIMRKQSYRFWRFNPHARGILRNFVRFIIGREFGFDFDDEQHGQWSSDKKKLTLTNKKDDPLVTRLVWDEFVERDKFIQRAKELVLRTFRDGEGFIRKFEKNGRIRLRFVEPSWVQNPTNPPNSLQVQEQDIDEDNPDHEDIVGKATTIASGVEHLKDDAETVIAYHIKTGENTFERVPAKEMIHSKPFADANDMRGFTLLEPVAKRLTNYDQWEEYRMILNKARTAIWLVRRIEGTATQAAALIAGRASPRPQPTRQEPVTISGRREAMPQPGTTLTPSAGVKYEYLSPNLDAKDASEDGRRFLMSIAAGVGIPEMLVTGDWSNSNFASSVEARTPAVREWEDWQDFFEPIFKQIYRWVIKAAKNGLGLPAETSDTVELQWPSLISKDAAKETERNSALNAGGILSKTTWAAREDLSYDEELDNMRVEAELEGAHVAAIGELGQPPDGTSPKPKQQQLPGQSQRDGAPVAESELQAALENLSALAEEVDSSIEDPMMKMAMSKYVSTAMQLVHGSLSNKQRLRKQRSWRVGRAAR